MQQGEAVGSKVNRRLAGAAAPRSHADREAARDGHHGPDDAVGQGIHLKIGAAEREQIQEQDDQRPAGLDGITGWRME